MLSIVSYLKSRKSFGKISGFRRNCSTISQILIIHQIIEKVGAKNFVAKPLFVDFFPKAFDSIRREKMGQMLQAYDFLKETINALMMFNKTRKQLFAPSIVIATSSTLVLESYKGKISTRYDYNLPRDCNSNDNRSNKRKWLYTKKVISRRYLTNYVHYLALLANTSAQAESLM